MGERMTAQLGYWENLADYRVYLPGCYHVDHVNEESAYFDEVELGTIGGADPTEAMDNYVSCQDNSAKWTWNKEEQSYGCQVQCFSSLVTRYMCAEEIQE